MAENKRITVKEVDEIAGETGFPRELIVKDYFITFILYLLKDIQNIYFKGGTALNKIFLDYARLSEDIDFTLTQDVTHIKHKIEKILKESNVFKDVSHDKHLDHFVRLIAHYKDPFGNDESVFLDLNKKANILLSSEQHAVPHFYSAYIPQFFITTLNHRELFAEKMRATIERNKPRDHFDLYQIIKRNMPLDIELVKKKCVESGCEMNITKMFNKANKLKRKWDVDIGPLLAEEISFSEVMKTLAKHFKLKEEKEKLKKTQK